MNFVLDEHISRHIADALRNDGHDVFCVSERVPSISDDAILAIARETEALVITADKDFGELVYSQRLATRGVILVRLAGLSQPRRAAIVADVVRQHGSELEGAFTVIRPGLVRIRKSI
jgi:predicted nuclease of predicted toxin-antitoxin system